ncbi:AlpA family phage regulatory protein [Hydrogenimonas thermophila]|uniref:helix-turn-helix transcriptional regulator n=1 Tax=Hydrogenimonas thermophila TaxID=223786 RepID=UPI002937433C|nr:helix-turn-helix domain-containing protein [Hydrogenimonas thermophila]WOE70143.1 AlpA family phage regulatory protein [Hydrogenimonas thermophila]WOE72660.1 AlpA family phage regulatory protein [Hydrogenimonas thermophila]
MNIQLPIENAIQNAIQNAIKPLETEIKSLKEMLQNFERSKQFNDEMLTNAQVAELLKIGKSTVWHKRKNDPAFPKPIKIGNIVRWNKKEIIQYLENQENKI